MAIQRREVTEAHFRQRQRPRRTGKPLCLVTPTQRVMDRLAAYAATEGADPGDIAKLRLQAGLQA
jgi:hypothetical protein